MDKINRTLKEELSNNSLLRVMGCHNPLGAKIAEEAQFDAVWFSGFEFSTSNCVPDASILTMTENLYALSAITRCINIPLIADCDSGFGDINNVIFMVREYERIGVAAACIEDKVFPKLNSFCNGSQQLLSIKEFTSKIIAALNARLSKNFLIIARIESFIAGLGVNDAIERANAYSKAGADALLIHSKAKDTSEITAFCKSLKVDIPLIIVPTTYNNITIKEVKEISKNIKAVIYPNYEIRASIKAMKEICNNILINDSASYAETIICSMEEAFKYQGMKKHLENYDQFYKLADEYFK